MGMSDRIEAFILELMRQEQEDWLKIQRNELAQLFGCVPSQINYVISTRFSPERGYIVESRRGGGGCVKIRRAPYGLDDDMKDITAATAESYIKRLSAGGYITGREEAIIRAALSDEALSSAKNSGEIRASALKCIMKELI